MKRSPKLKHKFIYAFGPPGWSHDRSTLTIKQMRQKLKEERIEQQKQRELELEVAE